VPLALPIVDLTAFVAGCALLVVGVGAILAAIVLHLLRVVRMRPGFIVIEAIGVDLLALAAADVIPEGLAVVAARLGLGLMVPIALAYAIFRPKSRTPPPRADASGSRAEADESAPVPSR
jgi:hypothetical protein